MATGGVATLPLDGAEDPALTLDQRGGDVWAWEKMLSGVCRGLDDEAGITVVVDDVGVPARREGDRFSATVNLAPGANTVQAIATLGPARIESDPVVHTVRLSPRPTARIAASVIYGCLALDASPCAPSGYDAAPIVGWSWSLRPGEPVASRAWPIGNQPTVSAPLPDRDGEHLVSLTVTDDQGREDTAAVRIVVEAGHARIADPVTERAAWIDGATIYGVVVRNVGPDGYRSVIDRLDDLADLGVAAIWLAPINVTLPGDFGYAVVDYFDLRPEYGTLADLKRLVQEAHARNIRVLMDVVPNHTSSEHPYHADAARHGERSPYHGFYDRDSEGNPTHYFSWTHLPNLDFEHPEVRRFVTEALMYWVREADIDGFRIDVAWGIRQRRPDFWPEFSAEFHRVKPDGLLIAEASARDAYYVTHGFDAAYDWTDDLGVWAWTEIFGGEESIPAGIRRALTSRAGDDNPRSLVFRFLNNNDTGPRFITTHGVDRYHVASAMLLTLPGLPCLYTGDEVGAKFEPYANPGPIDWTDRHGLRDNFRDLVRLRRQLPALAGPNCTMLVVEPVDQVLAYERTGKDGESPALVLLNFGRDAVTATLQAAALAELEPHFGPVDRLTDALTGASVVLDGDAPAFMLPPRGFLILTADADAPTGPAPDATAVNPLDANGRATTLKDIATLAGVSQATVSRVVNQSVRVDPATEERVLDAINRLGYRPNLLARSFRRKITQTIGLVIPDNSNPYFAEIARVIEDAGFTHGYSVILCNSDLSESKQAGYIDVLLAKRVDGIILISTGPGAGHDAMRDIERIQQTGTPCVVIDRDLGEARVDQILVDNHEGGYLAGRCLIDHGHTDIACVVGPNDLTPSAGRIAGFRRALDEAGIALPPDALVRGNGRHDGGARAVAELARREVKFSAVFAFNDEMAIGLIGALQRAGRSVPGDVSVIGFDNVSYGAAVFPAVTTIAQPIAEMGRTGLAMLLDRIRNPDALPRRELLSTRLLVRESVAPRAP